MKKSVFDLTDDEWAAAAKQAGQDAARRALARGRSVRGVDDATLDNPTLIDISATSTQASPPAGQPRARRRKAA